MRPLLPLLLAASAALASLAAHAAPPALSQADHAVLERVTYGPTPLDVEEMARLGRDRYLRSKLAYEGDRALPHEARAAIAALRVSRMDIRALAETAREQQKMVKGLSEEQRRAARKEIVQRFGELDMESAERRTIRALYSRNQLQEMLTWFWFNHFSVFQGKGPVRFLLPDYEEQAIRPHVLGSFRELLMATLTHPAMLVYLDNAQNHRGKINENYARELLELHTLGVDGGYTQADVQALARILTGATVNLRDRPVPKNADVHQRGLFVYAPRLHDDTPQTFLGTRIEGPADFAKIERIVDMLARHPSTARFVSRKLAIYFHGDAPPQALVNRMAEAFLHSNGNIPRVLQAMFDSPEFGGAALPPKFKDPVQYVYSSVRLLYPGQVLANHRPVVMAIAGLGEPLYGRQTPDGYGLLERDWASPGQLEKRFEVARMLPLGQGRLFVPQAKDEEPGPALDAARRQARVAHPVQAQWLQWLVDAKYSEKTRASLADAPPGGPEWASLVLSAPEFMYR